MTDSIRVADALRERLRLALIDERELLDSVRRSPREPIPDVPGQERCRLTLAVRRPLDPETSEMRSLEVRLRPAAGGGLEICAIDGLPDSS